MASATLATRPTRARAAKRASISYVPKKASRAAKPAKEAYTAAPAATAKLVDGGDYPVTPEARQAYVGPEGPVTAHAFRVYDACAQIPEGQWSTYGELAKAIGSSPRAVGGALGKNPFCPLPVPCHRIVSSSGGIGGFSKCTSGKNIDRKRALLEKEGAAWEEESTPWSGFSM